MYSGQAQGQGPGSLSGPLSLRGWVKVRVRVRARLRSKEVGVGKELEREPCGEREQHSSREGWQRAKGRVRGDLLEPPAPWPLRHSFSIRNIKSCMLRLNWYKVG